MLENDTKFGLRGMPGTVACTVVWNWQLLQVIVMPGGCHKNWLKDQDDTLQTSLQHFDCG